MAKAKRLPPKGETLRELFLKCGNQCAFPGCDHLMMNRDGVFIGQVCHIEAAEEGGERFNKDMNDEDRRAFKNLLLMCYAHHQVTNDVDEYTVAAMQKMKADHETKFTDPEVRILEAIEDKTKSFSHAAPTSLKRMNEVLGWGHSDEELEYPKRLIEEIIQKLRPVPMRSRQLFIVLIERAKKPKWGPLSSSPTVPHSEIREATGLKNRDVVEHVITLTRYGLEAISQVGLT